MLYYLFEYLENEFQLPGAGLFQFLSFRSAFAILISLLFTLIFGKYIINFLKEKQVGESIRELGLIGQKEKEGTKKKRREIKRDAYRNTRVGVLKSQQQSLSLPFLDFVFRGEGEHKEERRRRRRQQQRKRRCRRNGRRRLC